MKNIIKHALITGVLCLSLCSVMFAQENGYVYWCSNDSLTSSPSSGAYFATDKFKKGSRVQLNVNGISKEYTVTDSIKDKNALCAVSASDAKTMGFYYTQKEMCSVELIRDSEVVRANDKTEWYNITGLKSKDGNACTLVKQLVRKGYKVCVNPFDFTCSILFVPEYLIEHEIESIKDVINASSAIRIIKTNVIL